MALQYLDKEGLEHFWKNTKEYIDKTDEKLQSEIDAITGGGTGGGGTSLAGLQEALNQEISDRTEADNTLQSNIDSEAATRSEKDTELQSNIEAEAVAREEADTNLSNRIDELGTGNQEALETLEAKVDQEIEDRKAGDAALLGTEEDAKELNTIYGLRAQIEFEASNAEGAVSNLEKKLYGADPVPGDIEGYTLTDLHDNLASEVEARTAADDTLSEGIAAEATTRASEDERIHDELLGTEADDKSLNTIHGLRNQIEYEAGEADGAVNSLREEVAGGNILVEGKIPSTHTLNTLETRIEAEETNRASEVTRLEGLIDAASSNSDTALKNLRNEIYGSEVENVDADHTLTHLETTKVEIESGTANNLTVNGLTASAVAGNVIDFRNATTRVKTLTEEEAQTDKTKNQGTAAASIQFVSDVVNSRISQSQALVYKGVIRTKEELEAIVEPLVGWLYKVAAEEIDFTNQTYINDNGQGYLAHRGDMIVCQTAGGLGNLAKWDIIKHNDEGQVIGPSTSVVDRIAVFSDETGKAIKVASKTVDDISAEIDSDVAAAKSELLGTGDTSDDTIKGSKKYTDEQIAATKLSTVTIPVRGDSAPAGSFADNTLTINLPQYRLESKASTQDINEVALNRVVDGVDESFKFENNKLELNLNNYILESKLGNDIEGTIQDYVDSKVAGSSITTGSINHEVPDNESETISFDTNSITLNLNEYALQSALEGVDTRLTTAESDIDSLQAKDIELDNRIKVNEGKLADVVDTTVGALIDSDIAVAKAELIGVDSDASTADTIWGAKKRTDEAKAELQGKIDTLNSETIKTITITEDAGDEGPSVVPTTNTVAIHLPNYRLESEADALDITKGALVKIGDDVHEDVTVANNTVTVSLHNYTLQTSHNALSTRTTTLETLTAGDWRAQNDEGTETNTIKSYIDLKSDRIPDSEITDLMDRLNG